MIHLKRIREVESIYKRVLGFCEVIEKLSGLDPSIWGGEVLIDALHRSIGVFVCQLCTTDLSVSEIFESLPIYEMYMKIREVDINNRIPIEEASYPMYSLKRLFFSIADVFENGKW